LIKKWANVAKIDFACAPYNNGRIMVFDRNKKKIANETRAG
jgi:hypothetical protein